MRRVTTAFLLMISAVPLLLSQGTPPSGQTPPKPAFKPYAELITKEAKSDSGMFIVHRIKEKLYFEVPFKEFGKELLLVTTQARTQPGLGYGGDGIARCGPNR